MTICVPSAVVIALVSLNKLAQMSCPMTEMSIKTKESIKTESIKRRIVRHYFFKKGIPAL